MSRIDATHTLEQVISDHRAWRDGTGGSCANLSRADLSGATLSRVNLFGANLSRVNLSHADLSHANLSHADLSHADLSHANLSHADLSGAILFGANLFGANLSYADLSDAILFGANLSHANLSHADLSGATLFGTTNFKSQKYLTTPEKGSFIGFKKVKSHIVIVKIEEKTRRLSAINVRKCRASQVTVLRIETMEGRKVPVSTVLLGDYDNKTKYQQGKVTKADKLTLDITNDCGHGIHFFLTKEEAIEY